MDENNEFQVGNRDLNDTTIVIEDWDNDTDDENDQCADTFILSQIIQASYLAKYECISTPDLPQKVNE